ncbi:MAG: copper chaperone PCu(A)C [Wenzhouxiangella sp.]|nr:copper chaperone PCu(A)C [Wenzhouxiangella sp.]
MFKFLLPVSFLLLAIGPALADQGGLTFDNAWTPEAPPGRMMAGFMEIHNTGPDTVAIVDGRANGFGHVELHNTTMEDGVMRMRRIEALSIAPGQTLVLEPGGLHLMLIEPQRSFRDGDQIELVLTDSDGREYSLSSEVRPRRR